MLILHRSCAIVAASVQGDGTVLVLDGGREVTLSAEAFATQYAPATVEEVRRLAPASSGNGTAALAAPAKQLGPGRGHYPRKGKHSGGRSIRRVVPTPAKASAVPSTSRSTPAEVDGRRSKISDEQWRWAEQQWKAGEGTIAAIAAKIGCSDPTVHNRAKLYKWGKRPKRGVSGAPADDRAPSSRAPAAAPKDWVLGRKLWDEGKDVETIAKAVGVTSSAVYARKTQDKWLERAKGKATKPRVCQSCGLMTTTDPCHNCGKSWTKTWKDD